MSKRNYAKRETKEYNFLTEVFQWFCLWILCMPYILLTNRIKVIGRENLKKDMSYIVAPTHNSYFDPIVTSYATQRPIAYMAKKELYDVKWLCPFIVGLGTFAVNRAKFEIATIRTAQAVMKTNRWLIAMFPQGTRDEYGKVTTINPGFAYLARMSKAEILPISIKGGDKMFRLPFTGTMTIKIGKPFKPSKNMSDTMEQWCKEIESLGDFKIEQTTFDKIRKIKEKENNESTNSAS